MYVILSKNINFDLGEFTETKRGSILRFIIGNIGIFVRSELTQNTSHNLQYIDPVLFQFKTTLTYLDFFSVYMYYNLKS